MGSEGKQHAGIYFLMLLVPLFWGGAFSAAKHIVTEVPPITAATLRFGAAGIILLVLVMVKSEWKWDVLRKGWLGLLLMSLTGVFGYNAFFFWGLESTTAINGSLIMATSPVFITVGAVLFLQESWQKGLGFGLLLSLAGVFIVVMQGSLQTLASMTFNTGDLLFVGALFCWVAYGLIGKAVMQGASPLFTTTITTLIGSFFLAIWSLFEGGWGMVADMSGQSWIEMIFIIVCASVIAFILWNKGVQQIGASKSSMYMNLVPINAAWVAVLFYGSPITWPQIAGMMMVIIGVYCATMGHHFHFRLAKKEKISKTNV